MRKSIVHAAGAVVAPNRSAGAPARSARGEGAPVTLIKYKSEALELKALCGQLIEIKEEDPDALSDCAILCRFRATKEEACAPRLEPCSARASLLF